MKVKTLKDNVLVYGNKKGTELEVSEEVGKHLLNVGAVEEVKEAPKKTTSKKAANKKAEKEGE